MFPPHGSSGDARPSPNPLPCREREIPTPKELLTRFGFFADKRLGQHFLLDLNVTRKIVRQAGVRPGDAVIEVGPGPGGLTFALLEAGAHVTAVEKDPRFAALVREWQAFYPEALHVVEADALGLDLATLTDAPAMILSNLPYNIGSQLLIGWLRVIAESPGRIRGLTLMFQKEVADRVAASPGGKVYGRLSVMAQWLCTVRPGFDLPPSAFTPPPKIDSSVVHLEPHAILPTVPFAVMERIVAAAFGQRRKMLRAALKSLGVPADGLLEQAGIEPTLRAEALSVAEFVRLAEALIRGE